jgi:hypothetical protein
LTSDRKIRANRANAQASTGPKTTQGRIRSGRNALRHGLSLPVRSHQGLFEEIETLAREIAGPDPSPEIHELACLIAEAQSDLDRVRDARHQLLSQALSDPNYQDRKKTRAKLAKIGHLLRANATDVPLATLLDVTRAREDPKKIAVIVAQEVQQLSAMDRYERRARSRRKSAVRAFDLAKRNPCIKGTRGGV